MSLLEAIIAAKIVGGIAPGSGGNVEPTEDDIPKVFFGNALPQTKDEVVMSFRYISKTKDINGWCKTKAQGNSSMTFPKKNQTVKLYADAECTEKLKVNFKGWGNRNKFCFKANWVDLTHARNIVSARLWGDVVKSRQGYENMPELLRTSPNQGAIDGFPVKVYANGVYQGRYTLNIPKDAWMANMDKELDTHCILCGENYESACFRAEAVIDGSDWTDEVHDTVPDAIKTRWNEAIRFVMNSTDKEFVSGIGNYFDIESLIDYFVFGVVICNMDGFGKNQLYHTYDGQKWYATVYDMDSTLGTYFNVLLSHDYARTQYEDYKHANGNLLYVRLRYLFIDQIKQRYMELKQGALSLDNIINRFERFTDIVPLELVREDYANTTAGGDFNGIPLKSESNIQQIRNYIVTRYPYVDSYIEALEAESQLLYRLPAETTFDGVDDYIDTGVKLFDTAKNFTILLDVTRLDHTESGNNESVYSCMSLDPYGGEDMRTNPYANSEYIHMGVPGRGGFNWANAYASTARAKVGVVFESGVPSFIALKTADNDAFITISPYMAEQSSAPYTAYMQHNESLLIGCRKDPQLTGFFSGTIHSFEVYEKAMSLEEIAEKFTPKQLIYKLPSPITVDSTAWTGQVETGVKLFDEPKSFTLICEATLADECQPLKKLWSCTNEYIGWSDPIEGAHFLQATTHEDGGLYFTGQRNTWSNGIWGEYTAGNSVIKSKYSKHVVVVKNGVPTDLYFITEVGGQITHMTEPTGDVSYVKHDGILTLGMAMYSYGGNNLVDATIHSFEVWDYAMTAEEVAEKLA